ncbi:MAG: galactokinase [Phycisphaerales bacterium]|nr:MAG: galactokinase [Phycisphaerales bacterium]
MADQEPVNPVEATSPELLLGKAVGAFRQSFRRSPTLAAAAPGRVNLIGEHTDYNDGFVLPIAIDRQAVVVAGPDEGAETTIHAVDLDETFRCDLQHPLEPVVQPHWANYLLGVAHQFKRRGLDLPNLRIAFTSSVPIGAGLSSSAAIEVATATLLEQVIGEPLPAMDKALLCQRAEHDFPGTPCGIMDMFIAVFARRDHALLIDCRSCESRPIHMPPSEEAVLLIVDTGVKHELATGEYARRRATCERAAKALGVAALRDASPEMLDEAGLTQIEHQRALHVVLENERTVRAAELLDDGSVEGFGELMFQSHESLRYLYEVSCDELNVVVDEARLMREAGGAVLGARMTGGGFGGCAIVLCRPQAVGEVRKRLAAVSVAEHRPPMVYATGACEGTKAIPLPKPAGA